MGLTVATPGTVILFEVGDGKAHIYTRQHSILRSLIAHPRARLVKVDVDGNGELELPLECFRIFLTGGESELELRCAGKKRPTAQ